MSHERLSADVVVVGSGAGGASAAAVLAARGLDVIVLELGDRERPSTFTQREEQMLPRLFQDAAARTTADRTITVLQGSGVGGSTLHNLNLCKRIDDALLDAWARDHALPGLAARLRPHYDAIEQTLAISFVPEAEITRNNRILRDGAAALGWRNGPVRHNRVGCRGSGFCELGCAYDAKMNAAKVLIPAAEADGARVIPRARVTAITHRWGRATGVRGVRTGADGVALGSFEVHARGVVLGASATGSSALVIASGIRDPYRRAGRGLYLHPGATVGGIFPDAVTGWRGIPQSWECTEHLDPLDPDRRVWIVPVFGHPVGVAAMLPGIGAAHVAAMGKFAHVAALTPMLHDVTRGHVDVDADGKPVLHYRIERADLAMMAKGVSAAARILLAAGAEQVLIPTARPFAVTTDADAAAVVDRRFGPLDPALAAVHPMGGLAMGGDPRRSVVGPDGQHHRCRGLWVADGSLFPTSTGVPPQWSIYALGRMVGTEAAAALAG